MRILFISRASLFQNKGGDTIQIEQTARALRNAGILVDIRLSNEQIDYAAYSLIHFFNVIRPADILYHAERSGLPFVVSTIFVDYTEIERAVVKGWRKWLFLLLGRDRMEYIKAVARQVKNGEKIQWKPYWWRGHKYAVRLVLRKAACLLPNSESEYQRLVKAYGVTAQYTVVPNGIDLEVFNQQQYADVEKDRSMVLCVARIEPLKNQHHLISALNNTPYQLYLIGKPSLNHMKYYEYCKSIAAPNIHFTGPLEQAELLPYYAKAAVHALPSWFETTGLSSLEAAAMGCNIVVSPKGDVKDYFPEEEAFYCDPGSSESIFQAVTAAAKSRFNRSLQRKVEENYHWKAAAVVTLNVYRSILEK